MAMKLYYDSIEDPRVGHVVFGVSEKGLRIVSFGRFAGLINVLEHACSHKLEARENPQKTKTIGKQLAEYLNGKRDSFDTNFDIDYLPPFKRKALRAALKIPRGKVITYGQLAKKSGSPKASRAAGQAMATNPIPIAIPCHRVVGSDGYLTGYGAGDGIALKKQLLEMEGVSMRGMKAVLG
jgi:methylated-DNA-[protein]-cysteine S-methyltransferase